MTLPADVQEVDDSGYVWAFLDRANAPERVRPGAIIVAGDPVEPFRALVRAGLARRLAARGGGGGRRGSGDRARVLARVVDIVAGSAGRSIVHRDVLGVPEATSDELRHAQLLPS